VKDPGRYGRNKIMAPKQASSFTASGASRAVQDLLALDAFRCGCGGSIGKLIGDWNDCTKHLAGAEPVS